MNITVESPVTECARCGATAPLQPQILRRVAADAVPPGYASSLAKDDAGGTWIALAVGRPVGWAALDEAPDDSGRGLCPRCATDWARVRASFLKAPPVDEVPVLPPPPSRIVHKAPMVGSIPLPADRAPTVTQTNTTAAKPPIAAPSAIPAAPLSSSKTSTEIAPLAAIEHAPVKVTVR